MRVGRETETQPYDPAMPIECSYCWTPRWNDESVMWLPLRGDARHPYCADGCAQWVMQPARRSMKWWQKLRYRLRPLVDPLAESGAE